MGDSTPEAAARRGCGRRRVWEVNETAHPVGPREIFGRLHTLQVLEGMQLENKKLSQDW